MPRQILLFLCREVYGTGLGSNEWTKLYSKYVLILNNPETILNKYLYVHIYNFCPFLYTLHTQLIFENTPSGDLFYMDVQLEER